MKRIIILAALFTLTTTAFASTVTSTNGQEQLSVSEAVNAGNEQNVTQPISVNIDQSSSGPASSSTQIHYSGEYDVRNVPATVAPGLTTTMTETCMGSTSASGSGVGFGVSFGTTWRDTACVRRLDSRQLQALGYTLAAKELMCDEPKIAAALKRAGKPCFNDLPENQKPKGRSPVTKQTSDPDVLNQND